MDFTNMDATATHNAFRVLQKYCSNHGITVVYAGAIQEVRNMLIKHDIAGDESFFSSAESALVFCENEMLSGTNRFAMTPLHTSPSYLLRHFLTESDDLEFPLYNRPIFSGSVALSHESIQSRVDTIRPGSLFGEVEFFSLKQRQSTAKAKEQSTVFQMSREMYELVQFHHPSLWFRIDEIVMKSMATALSKASFRPRSS
ncbi:LOW QUALITY PROTEIN: Sulfate Permease, partial [Phytophthora megakarya]